MPFGVPELFAYKLRETLEAESLLLGLATHEGFSAAWPSRDGEFADKMNAMPKHVVTTTLHELGWNAAVLSGNVLEAIQTLKTEEGGPSSWPAAPLLSGRCSSIVWSTIRLMVVPVIIGGGLTIFPPDREKTDFELSALEHYSSSVTLQVYRPKT
jgi:dihydrofolate reductase